MSGVLDNGMQTGARRSHRIVGATLLACWTSAYLALCFPAIMQRGYPPIDYFWDGVTYVWVFAVPIFALVVPQGRFSLIALLVYSAATGFISCLAEVWMVPKHIDWQVFFSPFWLLPAALYGGAHLGVAVLLAWLTRRVLRRRRSTRITAVVCVVTVAAGFPIAYRQICIERANQGGRERADADWKSKEARVYMRGGELDRNVGGCLIVYNFDPQSGLPIELDWLRGYEGGYNRRIGELVAEHGAAAWSFKTRMVANADLISMLHSTQMTEIKTLPCDVTSDIVVWRGGDINRWGRTLGSSNDAKRLNIGWLHDDVEEQFMSGLPSEETPICVGRLAKYADVVFLRFQNDCVAAFTTDGWMLESAFQEDAVPANCPP